MGLYRGTAFEAFDNCPIKNGMTVVRKNDKRNGRGVVQSRKAVKKFLNGQYVWVVRCVVAWEGATNGAQRFRGGKWNITTTVLASNLDVLDVCDETNSIGADVG